MARKTTKRNKEISCITEPKAKWFVLRCFNKDDKDDTGFLGIDEDFKTRKKGSLYKIVKDQKDALKFPSSNVYNVDSFGTPKQWLDFFSGEHELSSWKFHLAKVKDPRVNKLSAN